MAHLRARSALFDLLHAELGAVRQAVEGMRSAVLVEDARLIRLAAVVTGLGGVKGADALLFEVTTLRRRLWNPALDQDGL